MQVTAEQKIVYKFVDFNECSYCLLCPNGITTGDLEQRGSKAPSRTIAMKKVGKQSQLTHRVTRLFVNAESEVATNNRIVNSYFLWKSMKES
jgi:hypothetical protein